MARTRKATVHDVHAIAAALPEVERHPTDPRSPARAAYRVKGKSFVFFRDPRKDAHDPVTGELYDDVIAFHCSAEDKESMVGDSPWFTTPHWNGYNAVLLRECDLDRLTVDELREVITDAWLVRAPKRLAEELLDPRSSGGEG
ncbi:MmcQ/YjbR family DNA-binding protein [Intrasporangium sp. DVR]|uniref:MmcQ/YjbR family DNA-binding protein n=1 Tax=Intrasporangium sp. DVR TaxID=3127867 RepID=UPI00313A6854